MLFCMLPEEAELLILPAKMLTRGVNMCFTAYCVAVSILFLKLTNEPLQRITNTDN